MQYFLSRFAFVFLIFSVIISGYISEVLSCQLRRFIYENKYFRHLIAILMIFVFIMLEGGWSIKPERDNEPGTNNNWSSGNVLDTLASALGIYFIFIISSKSRLVPNLIFYGLVLLIYIINTQVNFWRQRHEVSEKYKEIAIKISTIFFMIAIAVLIYGFVDYAIYQKTEYGNKFSWGLFLLGTSKCAHITI